MLPTDTCLYLFEYTSHMRYDFSATNNLISNLKKKPSLSGTSAYKYKRSAIQQCAMTLATSLNSSWLDVCTLVPVPCSRVFGDPDYDDRMEEICQRIRPGLDVRKIVTQTRSTIRSHEVQSGQRLTVEDLLQVYQIDESKCHPQPVTIGIVDDVLTAGTHFRAMHTLLVQRFPTAEIYGIFVARRVFPEAPEGFAF